jgi:cytochrome b6-f complex iron-sulfur subunit
MNAPKMPRRDFLKLARNACLAVCGFLGLAGLVRFLDYAADNPPPTDFNLGNPSKFPAGSRTLLPDVPALLISRQGGFTALSLVCPHLGCTVEPGPAGFTCPCHGSRFDPQGKVTHGPADRPLRALPVLVQSDGSLHVYTD